MEERKIFDKKFVHFMWDDSLEGKEGFFANDIDTLKDAVNYNSSDNRGVVKKGVERDPFKFAGGLCYVFFYYDPNYSCKIAYLQGKTIQFRNKGDANWIDTNSPNWIDRCEYHVKPEDNSWSLVFNNSKQVSVVKAKEGLECLGLLLIREGTEEECINYAVENYCKKCMREVSICCNLHSGCQGFEEKEVKKRRKTNRELAKWVAQGNGQVKHRDGNFAFNRYEAYDVRNDDEPCPFYWLVRGWDQTEWHEPLVEEAEG